MSGSFETRIVNHYAAVRKRIAYLPKRPIVAAKTQIAEPMLKPPSGIGRPPKVCRVRLLHLYLHGLSITAMAETFGVTSRAISKVIKRQGWKR